MTPAQAKALEDYRRYVEEYTGRKRATYDNTGDLITESLDDSGMGQIETDPRYREAELAALRELEDQSRNGFTARDQADITRVENQANRANRGRVESIRQNMQARGMGGSGLDLMAQLESSQNANEIQAMRELEQLGMMQDRKSQATMNLGSMSSQLQSRDFGQQAEKARAADAIKRFNVENRNLANQYNVQNRQNIANNNAQAANQFGDQNFQARSGLAQTEYNAATEDYNQAQARKEQRRRKRTGVAQGILGAAGAVAGGVLGSAAGPAGIGYGAMAGAQAGSALGGAFAQGGRVPGLPIAEGDHPVNDYVPILASPGEVVLPRSVSNDPDAAADFVARENYRQGYAMGGTVKPNFEVDYGQFKVKQEQPEYFEPTIGAQMPAEDDYYFEPTIGAQMPAAAEADDEGSSWKFPSFADEEEESPDDWDQGGLEGMSPLVRKYIGQKIKAQKQLKNAGTMQTMIGMADVAGNLFTDYANSQKPDRIIANNWQNLGKAPEIIPAKQSKWDSSALSKLGEAGYKRAQYQDEQAQKGIEGALNRQDKALDRADRRADRENYWKMQDWRMMSEDEKLQFLREKDARGNATAEEKNMLKYLLGNKALDQKGSIAEREMSFKEKQLEINQVQAEADRAARTGDIKLKGQLDEKLAKLKAAQDIELEKLKGGNKIKEEKERAKVEAKAKPLTDGMIQKKIQANTALKGLALIKSALNKAGAGKFDRIKFINGNDFVTGRNLFVDGFGSWSTGAGLTSSQEAIYRDLAAGNLESREVALKRIKQIEDLLNDGVKMIDARGETSNTKAPGPDEVKVMWKGKPKVIPRARLKEAILLGAEEIK